MLLLLALCNYAFKLEGIGNERFTIFYPTGYRAEARLTLSYLEQYYRHADQITGNRPGHLTFVIEDVGAESNGKTDPVAPSVHIFANVPYPDFHFGAMRSWWRTVSLHEYAHFSHLANVRGLLRYLRYPFGKVWLPNAVSALYMYEGLTVYTESTILPYEGRLNEGYYDAYTNLLALQGGLPTQNKLAHVPDDYPGGDSPYLFGGEFTEFLSRSRVAVNPYDKLAQYYNHYAGCCLLNVIGYDYSAKKVWGRNRNELFRAWQRQAVSEARYREIEGRRILTGYSLAYAAAGEQGIYVWRQTNRPLAYDYTASYGELLLADPATGKSKRVLSGMVSLPVRTEGGDLYAAVSDLRPGAKNYSLYGYGYVSSILRIRSGKIKKLFTGEIKAFAVRDGILYYAKKKGAGSVIYINKAEYFSLDSLLVQDMAFRDNGDLIFIGYREADGNNLYILTADRTLKQLTDCDFSFSGLSVAGADVFFSANHGGLWRPYRLNLESGQVYLLDSDDLAAYPVPYRGKLYYITIQPGAEALKEVATEEKPAVWPDHREKIPMPEPVAYTAKSVWENARSLMWPDISLPYYYPAVDSQSAYGGLIVLGHDALGVHEYNLSLKYDSTIHYDAVWNYRAFPPLSAALRINDQRDKISGLVDLLCALQSSGVLRQISLSSAFYPYPKDVDGQIRLRLKPGPDNQLNLYGAGFFSIRSDKNPGARAGFAYYQPVGFGLLVAQIQTGYEPDSLAVRFPSGKEIVGFYGAKAGLRFTAPVLAPQWGIDFPHFFIERIWATLEGQAGIAADALNNGFGAIHYNLLGYATANLSILNGFLKIRPSLGAVYDPDPAPEENKITPYFSVTADLLSLLDRMEARRRMVRTLDQFPEIGYQ